ncbi:MAG: hypothetical protein J6T01_04750 [Kiritimatiellae bacterium]|nr:hypothetical protein [Kiritimatiellia bacterium]
MTVRAAVSAAVPFAAVVFCMTAAAGTVHSQLPPAEGVSAAAFDYLDDVPASAARGVVVLVPGCNGDGAALLEDRDWADFASSNKFILAALTFKSEIDDLKNEKGYYATEKGSGKIAESAIRALGPRLPVVMYGFSGGAHFTASFAERSAKFLRGWCAASFDAENRLEPVKSLSSGHAPPGIVACGSEDNTRVGGALSYFYAGRELDRKWTWVEIDGIAHSRDQRFETFVRNWFAVVLKGGAKGTWVDISGGDAPAGEPVPKTLKCWLPSESLRSSWAALMVDAGGGKVVEHMVYTGLKGYEKFTMFLRMPSSGAAPKGVLCLCLLGRSVGAIRARVESAQGPFFDFAESRDFAVVAWGSHRLWDRARNYDELSDAEARKIERNFESVGTAWESGVKWFAQRYNLPTGGFLMTGSCGAGQFVQRLALRKPKLFLAVHMNIPGSFGRPRKGGEDVLWCITTGERLEIGYENSLAFFADMRKFGYPVVYKAYPGVSHLIKSPKSTELALAVFDYALKEAERAPAKSGRPGTVDWRKTFFKSPAYVADIVNQNVLKAQDADAVPEEYRIPIPAELVRIWLEK